MNYTGWEDFAIKNGLVLLYRVPIPIPYIVHSVTTDKCEVSFLHFNSKKILSAFEKICLEYKLKPKEGITKQQIRLDLDSKQFKFLYRDFLTQITREK